MWRRVSFQNVEESEFLTLLHILVCALFQNVEESAQTSLGKVIWTLQGKSAQTPHSPPHLGLCTFPVFSKRVPLRTGGFRFIVRVWLQNSWILVHYQLWTDPDSIYIFVYVHIHMTHASIYIYLYTIHAHIHVCVYVCVCCVQYTCTIHEHINVRVYMCECAVLSEKYSWYHQHFSWYRVASISRLLKIIGLFCKSAL